MVDAPATLAGAIEEFLTWQELDRHRSLGTIREYRKDLRGFVAFARAAGVDDIAAIDRNVLATYQRHLARLPVQRGRTRPLAPATRQRRLVSLRSFLRFAARQQRLPGDLWTMIDLPHLPERLPKPLERDDRDRIMVGMAASTLPQLRDRALLAFLLSTGCRIAEALVLDRVAVNRDRITVRGKGDRERIVLLTEALGEPCMSTLPRG